MVLRCFPHRLPHPLLVFPCRSYRYRCRADGEALFYHQELSTVCLRPVQYPTIPALQPWKGLWCPGGKHYIYDNSIVNDSVGIVHFTWSSRSRRVCRRVLSWLDKTTTRYWYYMCIRTNSAFNK